MAVAVSLRIGGSNQTSGWTWMIPGTPHFVARVEDPYTGEPVTTATGVRFFVEFSDGRPGINVPGVISDVPGEWYGDIFVSSGVTLRVQALVESPQLQSAIAEIILRQGIIPARGSGSALIGPKGEIFVTGDSRTYSAERVEQLKRVDTVAADSLVTISKPSDDGLGVELVSAKFSALIDGTVAGGEDQIREISKDEATSTVNELAPGVAEQVALQAVAPEVQKAQTAATNADISKTNAGNSAVAANNSAVSANVSRSLAGQSEINAVGAAEDANDYLNQVASLIAGAAALGTKLSPAAGFNDPGIVVGTAFFVASEGGAVLYVKGSTLETTVPSVSPALTIAGMDGQGAIRVQQSVSFLAARIGEDKISSLWTLVDTAGNQYVAMGYDTSTGLVRLGALDNSSVKTIGTDLMAPGLPVPSASIGEDKVSWVYLPSDVQRQLYKTFGVDTATGEMVVSAFSRSTLLQVLRDLFGPIVGFGNAKPGEDQLVDILGFLNLDFRFIAVDRISGLLDLAPFNDRTNRQLAADLQKYLNTSTGGGSAPGRYVANTLPFMWIHQNGQSQSVGQGTAANMFPGEQYFYSSSPTSEYGFMLCGPGGLRGAMGVVYDYNLITDFAPALDDRYVSGANTWQQVYGTSLMAFLGRRRILNGVPQDHIWRGIGSGGRRLDQVMRGTQQWTNGLAEFTAAVPIAKNKYGRKLDFAMAVVVSGTADREQGTTLSAMKGRYTTLVSQYNEDYGPLLTAQGISRTIFVLINQEAARGGTNTGGSQPAGAESPIEQAQYESIRDTAGIYGYGPSYFLPLIDPVHQRPFTAKIIGEYQGKAMDKIVREGDTAFKPLMPQSVTRSGSVVTLQLMGAWGHSIVIDTTFTVIGDLKIGAAVNYGFEYVADDGLPISITSIGITSAAGRTIRVDLSRAAPGTLKYARNGTGSPDANSTTYSKPGAWGNIRDTDPTPSVTDSTYTLYNWLMAFGEHVD